MTFLDLLSELHESIVAFMDGATRCSFSLTNKAFFKKFFDTPRFFGYGLLQKCLKHGHLNLLKYNISTYFGDLNGVGADELSDILRKLAKSDSLSKNIGFEMVEYLLLTQNESSFENLSRPLVRIYVRMVKRLPPAEYASLVKSSLWKKVSALDNGSSILSYLARYDCIDLLRFLFDVKRKGWGKQGKEWLRIFREESDLLLYQALKGRVELVRYLISLEGDEDEDPLNEENVTDEDILERMNEIYENMAGGNKLMCPGPDLFLLEATVRPEEFDKGGLQFYEAIKTRNVAALKLLLDKSYELNSFNASEDLNWLDGDDVALLRDVEVFKLFILHPFTKDIIATGEQSYWFRPSGNSHILLECFKLMWEAASPQQRYAIIQKPSWSAGNKFKGEDMAGSEIPSLERFISYVGNSKILGFILAQTSFDFPRTIDLKKICWIDLGVYESLQLLKSKGFAFVNTVTVEWESISHGSLQANPKLLREFLDEFKPEWNQYSLGWLLGSLSRRQCRLKDACQSMLMIMQSMGITEWNKTTTKMIKDKCSDQKAMDYLLVNKDRTDWS